MADPTTPAAPPPGPLVLDLDALTSGDLEDMEAYAGVPILPVLRTITESLGQEEGMYAALSAVPVKAVSALLGAAKRMTDPSFGPDRWREVRLADLLAPAANGNTADPPTSPPPATSKRAGKRASTPKGGAGGSGSG